VNGDTVYVTQLFATDLGLAATSGRHASYRRHASTERQVGLATASLAAAAAHIDVGPPTARDICPVLPFYLREHARPATRGIHFAGTAAALICAGLGVASRSRWYFPLALVSGYAPALVRPLLVRRTARQRSPNPLWSLVSDFRMAGSGSQGGWKRELTKAGIAPLTAINADRSLYSVHDEGLHRI